MASLLEHTVMPSGGDFTSLDACIDHLVASHADLVTADVYAEVKIDGTWSSADTAAVTINGLTTNATHYLLVYAATAARHAGIWTTSAYILSTTNVTALTIMDAHVRLDGFQINTAAINNHYQDGVSINDTTATARHDVSNCIIKGANSGGYVQNGIIINTVTANIWNTIIYSINGWDNGARCLYVGTGTANVYSNTFVGGGRCVLTAGTGSIVAKNVYASGVTTAYYNIGAGITMTTCGSSDTTGSVGLQNIAVDTDTFVNVSAGTEDFHLAADGLSPLQGVGTDTSGDAAPMNFTTDIDGETRSGTWDIGADEYTAGGATYNESVTFSSGPAISNSVLADLLGSIELASTPALAPAAIADFLGSIGLSSTPAASMIGGMDYSDALTLSSTPAVSMAYLLDIFPSLALLSNPALAVSAVADFYNSLTLASTPAAVMAAVADLLGGLTLASNPAFATVGGSDFYNSIALSSSPTLLGAAFKDAFGELSLLSSPAFATSALADLYAAITLASACGISLTALADLFAGLSLSSNPALSALGTIVGEALMEHLGVSPSLWASKKGLAGTRSKWYRPGVRGQRGTGRPRGSNRRTTWR
jgi:hypothetical protein